MVCWSKLEKNRYKSNRGFTLIECIVAVSILTLVAIAVFKAFLLSVKVNAKTYEKDRANVLAVSKLEEINKDPMKFCKKQEAENNNQKKDDSYDKTLKALEEREYYNSQWEKVDTKNQAKYEVISKVDGWINRIELKGLEPSTSMETRRYNTTFMKRYLGILVKNPEFKGYPFPYYDEYNRITEYLFYVIYYMDDKEYEEDWNIVQKIGREIQDEGFKDYLNSDPKADDYTVYSKKTEKKITEFLDSVIRIKDNVEAPDGRRANCNIYKVYKIRDGVPIRIDFNKNSNATEYKVDLYNMSDTTMNLYIIHKEKNKTSVEVNAKGGCINQQEVYLGRDTEKFLYNINVEVKAIENGDSLIKKETKSYKKYDIQEN